MVVSSFQLRCFAWVRDALRNRPVMHIDIADVMAMIEVESSFRPGVVSVDGHGSVGLMQVLPATARLLQMPGDQSDAQYSIETGVKFLRYSYGVLLRRFGEVPPRRWIIAAYNAGPIAGVDRLDASLYFRKVDAAAVRWRAALAHLTPV